MYKRQVLEPDDENLFSKRVVLRKKTQISHKTEVNTGNCLIWILNIKWDYFDINAYTLFAFILMFKNSFLMVSSVYSSAVFLCFLHTSQWEIFCFRNALHIIKMSGW